MKGLIRIDVMFWLAIIGIILTVLMFTTPLGEIVIAGSIPVSEVMK